MLNDWDSCARHPDDCSVITNPSSRQACENNNEDCFGFRSDGTSCTFDFNDLECGNRRLLNVMILMKRTLWSSGQSWFTRVKNDTSAVEFNPKADCGSNGLTWPDSQIDIHSDPIFNQPLIRRASVFAHEAAHGEDVLEFLHCEAWVGVSGCECPGSEISCDLHWDWDGSTNRRTVEFIENVLSQRNVVLPPFVWYDAFQAANQRLDGRFERHPGFNLVAAPGLNFFYGSRKSWSFTTNGSQVETSISGGEWIDGATTVVQGIALTTYYNSVDDLRVCTTLRKYEAEWADFGLVPDARDISGVTVIPGQTDPEDYENPGCARRALYGSVGLPMAKVMPPPQNAPRQMGIAALRAKTDGNGNMREIEADYFEIDRGATVGPMQTVSSNPALPSTTTWDVSISAQPPGSFLTGIGFGAQAGRLNAIGANWSLGPELEARAGGLGGWNTNTVGACPRSTVPVGVAAKAVPSPYGTDTVGYFSLICAPDTWLNGTNPAERTYIRTSFMDTTVTPNVYYSDGIVTGWTVPTPHPPGTTTATCPVGHIIEGMSLRHGAEVDRIVNIKCSTLMDTTYWSVLAAQSTVPVNVGGTGGQLLEQNCRFAPGPSIPNGPLNIRKTMAPFFWYRSAWRLDGLALGCYPNIYDVETFEVDEGVFGSGTDLIRLQNGMDVGVGIDAPSPTIVPNLSGRWIDVSKITAAAVSGLPANRNKFEFQGYGTGPLRTGERWPPIEWSQQPESPFGSALNGSSSWHEGSASAIARAIAPGAMQGSVRIFEHRGVDLRHLPSSTGNASLEFRYFMGGPNQGSLRIEARLRAFITWNPSWWLPMWEFDSSIHTQSGTVLVNLLTSRFRGHFIDLRIVATTASQPAGDIVIDGLRIRTGW